MREIKFRGKRIDNGEWVYGCLAYRGTKAFPKASILSSASPGITLCVYEVNPDTVGQSTGLKDGNHQEIYEADIIDIWEAGLYEVEFSNGCFGARDHEGFSPLLQSIWGLGGVVVGNRHDNPNLIR